VFTNAPDVNAYKDFIFTIQGSFIFRILFCTHWQQSDKLNFLWV